MPTLTRARSTFWQSLKPRRPLRPSEWAERYRVLRHGESALRGPWRNANAPALAGLMDLCDDRRVEELVLRKAAQFGGSEAIRNVIAYFAAFRPDPVLLVLPDRTSGRKVVQRRIWPLFDMPGLAELKSGAKRDFKLESIVLTNGFRLTVGWAGSPASLSQEPARVVILDEVDKYVEWSGREARPVDLAYVRTQTYESRRLIIILSTPTVESGVITQRYNAAQVKLAYFTPCPECGRYQQISFARLRWGGTDEADKKLLAARISAGHVACWWECEFCSAQATDQRGKREMLSRGRWIDPSTQRVELDGSVVGDWPVGRRVAAQLPIEASVIVSWRRVVARHLESLGDPEKEFEFVTQWQGLPYYSQIVAPTENDIAAAREKLPGGIVPAWAAFVLATVDVQRDRFYWVVRAWGPGWRSHKVAHGMALGFDELCVSVLDFAWPYGDSRAPAMVSALGIDAGYRTPEVYEFAQTDPSRIKPLKGEEFGRSPLPLKLARPITYRDPQKRNQKKTVYLNEFAADHYKDRLAKWIASPGAERRWTIDAGADEDYDRQMCGEAKIATPRATKGKRERWEKRGPNHYWDCEVMQVVMAEIMRVDLLSETKPAPRKWGTRTVKWG